MGKYLKELKNLFLSHGNWWRRWKGIVTCLAMVVVFMTTYALILPAITLEKDKGKPEQGVYLENVERGSTASLGEDETDDGKTSKGQKSALQDEDQSDQVDDQQFDQESDAQSDQGNDQQVGQSSTGTDGTGATGTNEKDAREGSGQSGQESAYANGVYSGRETAIRSTWTLKKT